LKASAQWGYWWKETFMELIPDTSSHYNFVMAMDDESLKTLNDLLAGKRITEDKALFKYEDNKFFALKDYVLPDGNFFTSEIYKKTDIYQKEKRTVYILPRIILFLANVSKIDDIMEKLGGNVTLETVQDDRVTLLCQVKTSKEVLEKFLILNDLYLSGNYGIAYYNPHDLGLSIHPNNLPATYELDDFDENGMRLIFEKDWANEDYIVFWDGEKPDWSYEATDEGLAIINPTMKQSSWGVETSITGAKLSLEEGHDYIVRLTIKVPSEGIYGMLFGGWEYSQISEIVVPAKDDFQVFDVYFPNFIGNTWRDGYITLRSGKVVGTTVLKKVQVYEKQKGGTAAIKPIKPVKADGAIYNLAGQKVSSSYKGIVIKNGKKYNNK
jgi:hypothetical protein